MNIFKTAPQVESIDPDDIGHNTSSNPTIHEVMAARLHRRTLLKGGVSALATAGFSTLGLTACGGGSTAARGKSLGFSAVAKGLADRVVVPEGYTATVLYATGDSIDRTISDYKNDGTDDRFDRRSGDHHDGIQYYGLSADGTTLDPTSNDRAILVMNHENIAGTVAFMHPTGQTNITSGPRPEAEAIKELDAHGVSIIEVRKSSGKFSLNKASFYNRRITARTPMEISGPVQGSGLVKTVYSPTGTMTRGTINNCANGYTPWGTYLTCEENWNGYFQRAASDSTNRTAKENTNFLRVNIKDNVKGNNLWTTVVPADNTSTEFSRWNTSKTGTSADGTDDFRNVANTYGWVVEIDPLNPNSTPKKRTALGRFAHEGAWPSIAVVGKPIAFYMGDDSRGEYIYKFVSTENWRASDVGGGLTAGDRYMNSGTLYAAKFNADGTGSWLKLDLTNTSISGYSGYAFADMADVLVNARIAADAAGATKMDRPEWTSVNPTNGEVYITCTENPDRGNTLTSSSNNNPNPAADAANPRYWLDKKSGTTDQRGNVNGHIMRLRESNDDAGATSFVWDIFLFGAQAKADTGIDDVNYQANVNVSGLSDNNDFSKPDGCWFSPTTGILWIETDDNTYTDVTNCMLLAALPGKQGDGSSITIVNKAAGNPRSDRASLSDESVTTKMGKKLGDDNLRRFLLAPKGAEVTGVAESPDGKVLFVNIQHPGENTALVSNALPAASAFESSWPGNGGGIAAAYGPGGTTARPRSATIMITKNDGGQIGL